MRYRYQSGGTIYDITIERHGEGFRAILDGQTYELEVLDAQPGELSLRFAGRPLTLYWAAEAGRKWVSMDGCTYLLEKPSPRRSRQGGEATSEDILRSPMPAQVRSLEVVEGDMVEKGETLMLLEAMKMEIRIQALHQGEVIRLPVSVGQSVERDQVLVEIRKTKNNS
jgi:biotin carboxyl carrier protein